MSPSATRRRLVVPILFAAAILAAAPYIGQLRDWLGKAFPRAFAPALTVAFALVLAVAAAIAVRRIRHRRWMRLGGCALAGLLIAVQVLAFARDRADVSAVERVHILEYGLLALLLYWALRPASEAGALVLAALGAMTVGVVDEIVQWTVPTRVGEMRDVLLNWLAAGTGLVAAVSLRPPSTLAAPAWLGTRRAAGFLVAALSLSTVLFFDLAHLGHEVIDREEGVRFRSWSSPEELRRVAAERAARWEVEPPRTLRPLSREDTFLTEGTSHVSQRNRALRRGDAREAWKEQRILERWYAPVLEISGLSSGRKLGLAPWKRRQLEAQAAEAPGGAYTSPVFRYRIHLRPAPWKLWAAGGVIAAIGLGVAVAPPRRRRG